MATPAGTNVENPAPLHADKIVCSLDLFPELVRACMIAIYRRVIGSALSCSIAMRGEISGANRTATPQAAMKQF